MEGKNYLRKYSAWFLLVIYAVGVVGHLYDKTIPLMLTLTPFTLLLGAILILYSEITKNKFIVMWFLLSYLITFIIEVVGVKSKLIFGDYYYGNVLGTQLFDVPLIIGINWVMVVLGAISVAQRLFNKKLLVVISAGAISTLFDFILEPVAVKLGYWVWFNNQIPVQNYFAWFFISSIISILFLSMKIIVKKSLAEKYLYIQCVFFVILNFYL